MLTHEEVEEMIGKLKKIIKKVFQRQRGFREILPACLIPGYGPVESAS